MQYYEELTGALMFFIYEYHFELYDAEIITSDDEDYVKSYIHESEVLLLTRIVHHLLSGKTNLFYKFLEIMQNCHDLQYLVNKIQAEIISLDQRMLPGM